MAHASGIDLRRTVTRTGASVLLVFVAVAVGLVLALVAGFGLALVLDPDAIGAGTILVLGALATQAGFLLAAVGFLHGWTDGSFISFAVPDVGSVRVGVAALGVALAAETSRQLLVRFTEIGSAGTLSRVDGAGTAVLVAILVFTVVVAPPVEELLFRGVVQRYVREVSTVPIAVAVATVLFVPMHGLQILVAAPGVPAALATTLTLVIVSLSFGVAYAKTDTLVVPIGVHASYNALSVVVGLLVAGV